MVLARKMNKLLARSKRPILEIQACWYQCIEPINPADFTFFPELCCFLGVPGYSFQDAHTEVIYGVGGKAKVCANRSGSVIANVGYVFGCSLTYASTGFSYVLDTTSGATHHVNQIT